MGFALGCIHLSYDDFCKLTPEEFECICEAYRDQRESDYRERWERMRLHAAILMQPHVKKKITPQKLLPLPWEKEARRKNAPKPVSAEESKARFEKLAKRFNRDGNNANT